MMQKSRALLAVAIAGVVVGSALSTVAVASGGTIQGCVDARTGVLRVVATADDCRRTESPLTWNEVGPQGDTGEQGEQGEQGEAGTFEGSFASPNGLFTMNVTDSGIVLDGPTGTVEVLASGVNISGTLPVDVVGPLIRLNGCDRFLAGLGDLALGGSGVATITTASPTVCAD
jgi:hypothetical protein